MALAAMKGFMRQTRALCYKNLLVVIARRPLGFLLMTYGIPLAVLAVLLSIPSFLSSSSTFGVGSPAPIHDFASTVEKKLVIVRPSYLGPDVDRVIDAVTRGVDKNLVQFLDDETKLTTVCLANLRGISDCHASVTFVDSPETTATVDASLRFNNHSHTWQYVIRADPSRDDSRFDATRHQSDQENLYLPLQLAINNAITNETATPEVFMYTRQTEADRRRLQQEDNVVLVGQIYVFALFACYFFIIYRFTSFITADRETGMAQIVDAMGGGSATAARVVSWLIVFDLACLPCFIVFGVLYWHILFPTASAGILIGWQVLLGLAVNSATVFAAAFFTKSRVSAIYVVGGFLLLSVGAQVFSFQDDPKPSPPGAYLLSLLFPSSNHVFFTQQMCLWELDGRSAMANVIPPERANINSESYGVTQAAMLGFLALNIVIYPVLAVVVEKAMHGIDFRRRKFSTEEPHASVVAETFDLRKRFVPSVLERIFCCGRRKTVAAVNGVSFKGYKGQILCLVGPNGSGKTTTLHMISGFTSPTEGTITLNALPSQIGLCPQRNTLWQDLTVEEHVSVWSQIKAGDESVGQLDELVAACDLEAKRTSQAKTLSGGQKRKLQLACMFVGDTTVCLIDECTSGLDPLSRRAIWEILLAQRTKRSIVFTTHFLDEVDVLADHIVVLSKGKVRCQGAAAELKNLYGGGYKVHVPHSAPALGVQYPSTRHQDSLVYAVPDSRSAAQLSSQMADAGVTDVAIAGPQVEDVFLNVTDEPDMDQTKGHDAVAETDFEMEPSKVLPFWGQVQVLFRKRFTVLRRFWWPYFYVLALPLVITPFFNRLLDKYAAPSCANLEPFLDSAYAPVIQHSSFCKEYSEDSYGCEQVVVAPTSAKDDARDMVKRKFHVVSRVNESQVEDVFVVQASRQKFLDYVGAHTQTRPGGVYMGSGDESPVIAYLIGPYEIPTGSEMLNIYTQMKSNVEIISSNEGFAQTRKAALNSGVVYVIFVTLVQAIYPAAFVLYPAIEKARKVRSLEYANGVRRGPLWVAYGLFDFMFVFVISIAVTGIVSWQLAPEWNGPVWILLPVLALYGVAAILLGYLISHFVNGPLKSFLATAGVGIFMYAIAAIAFAVGSTYADVGQMDSLTLGITYGLNLLLPAGNVFRALLLGMNVMQVGCRDGRPISPGSIYAYGGPILYLVLQAVALLLLVIWVEGDIALFRRKGAPTARSTDAEKPAAAARSDQAESEASRVENTETDLLRVLHVSKSFGHNKAVDDVTLGLPESDVTALIGPNGAGKSTLVNLIQSELSPDSGRVLLKGEDARTRSAQKHLGVCPQFDALDLMNTREHLSFYARVKGIKDVRANVDHVMARLNLTPHAATLASKLSGGNKRKLSLAIALIGTPPVLILDEPTSAMDAVAKRSFWRIIQRIAPGRSLLLTTHSMEEADTLATRAALISRRILAVGTTKALRDRHANYYYVSLLLASAPNSSPEEMEGIRAWVQGHVSDAQLERDLLGGQVRFTIPGASGVAGLIELLERNKEALGVEYYSVGGATLEKVFLNVVRENNVREEDGVDQRNSLLRRLFLRRQ